MTRGAVRVIAGSLILGALAGCRGWIEERDPWRHDAEVECLRSGAVREGPAITMERPIDGPGMCGADFPLKVSVLGMSGPLGFADDLRPPAAIPRAPPTSGYDPPSPPGATYPAAEAGAPMPISPPGLAPPADGDPDTPSPPYEPPAVVYPRGATGQPSPGPWPPVEQVPLGPSRGPAPAPVGPATVTPVATLACPVVSMLDRWVAEGVQPAAVKWFNQPVIEIKQISAYSCRPMNGQRGNPISEHAFGNALDIAAFTLADGRRVTVKDGWRGLPEERGFLRDVQMAACQRFSTVLAPGSNAFHTDHIHVDLARHHSGRSICNPRAVPGDLVAGRPGDPYTGAIASRRPARGGAGFDRGVADAVAGED
jgi:hypothetical protein